MTSTVLHNDMIRNDSKKKISFSVFNKTEKFYFLFLLAVFQGSNNLCLHLVRCEIFQLSVESLKDTYITYTAQQYCLTHNEIYLLPKIFQDLKHPIFTRTALHQHSRAAEGGASRRLLH